MKSNDTKRLDELERGLVQHRKRGPGKVVVEIDCYPGYTLRGSIDRWILANAERKPK